MPLTAPEFCARALIRIGAQPITSFADGSAEAEIAALIYPQARESLLAAYPWGFAMRQAVLSRVAEAPLADYRYNYALPDDCLRVWTAGSGGAGDGLQYRLHGGYLQADAEDVVLTYIAAVDEEDGAPAYFDSVLTAKLAAEFCVPLTESTSRAESLNRQYEQEFARARLADAQADTPPRIRRYPLIDAR